RIYRPDPDYPENLSALAKPGNDVAEGDVIESINGTFLLTVADPSALLRNLAGRQTLIHIKPLKGKERDEIVAPMSMDAAKNLRYSDWEYSRRKIVEAASADTIGYVHLRAMGKADMDQWARDFYPVFNRQGLIVDVRHNGGGV